MTETANPLVGRCFVYFDDEGKVARQGVVRAAPEPGLYLIQYFDWIAGAPSTLRLVTAAELTSAIGGLRVNAVELFDNDEHLRGWLEARG